MVIYNVTCNVDSSVHDQWIVWMREHIPQVLGTGLFMEARFTKVLVKEQDGSHTYSIQYKAFSAQALQEYKDKHSEALQKDGLEKWADKVLSFRTELEVVDEYTVRRKEESQN